MFDELKKLSSSEAIAIAYLIEKVKSKIENYESRIQRLEEKVRDLERR